MSCGGCCQDFITCCQNNCAGIQPVVTSGPAICAAECTTIGTADTINALVSSGLGAVTAIFTQKTKAQTAATAVKAQAQAKTTTGSIMWIVVGVVAIAALFLFWKRK